MISISKQQMKVLDDAASNHYHKYLASVLRKKWFVNGVARVMSQTAPGSDLGDLARKLVQQANSYGIDAEGDVTPFCLLAVFDDPAFRQSPTYGWIIRIISQKDLDPEARMDAVYSFLPANIRELIFHNRLSA